MAVAASTGAIDPAGDVGWHEAAPGQWCLQFRVMGGPAEIRLAGLDATSARQAADTARAELARIEGKFSRYNKDSVVGRINARCGSKEWTDIDEETHGLLVYAAALHRESGGRFDISSGVYRLAWDFAQRRVPTDTELAELRPRVDARRVELERGRVRLAAVGMQIDLGGIGKEYAADRAAALLVGQGVCHGYVNLAGDLCALGPQPDGTPWQVGIQHPRDPQAMLAQIPLFRGGLATSGDYQRRIVRDGRYLHHVLDARTGWPVLHWQSVSVAAPRALAAGSLCTLAMLMGADAIDFLTQQGVAYLARDVEGRLFSGRARPAT